MRCFTILLACGWLLFTPPTQVIPQGPAAGKARVGVVTGAPLSEWKQEMAFDSAKECEEVRKRITESKGFDEEWQSHTVWNNSRCIPSDTLRFLVK